MLESLRYEIHAVLPNRASHQDIGNYGRFSNAYEGLKQDNRLSHEPLGVGRKSGKTEQKMQEKEASTSSCSQLNVC